MAAKSVPMLRLKDLHFVAVAFLDLAAQLRESRDVPPDRPALRTAEMQAFRWLQLNFESPEVLRECIGLTHEQSRYYADLQARIIAEVLPDHRGGKVRKVKATATA